MLHTVGLKVVVNAITNIRLPAITLVKIITFINSHIKKYILTTFTKNIYNGTLLLTNVEMCRKSFIGNLGLGV